MTIEKKLYKVAMPDTQYCFRPNLFIWAKRTLFFGPLRQLDLHAMGAIAINIGLYQPFFIQTEHCGPFIPYRCAIIPAGCRHRINAHGNIMASLIIEKNSADYEQIKQQYSFDESAISAISDLELVHCLQKIHQEKPTKNEVASLLNQCIGTHGESTHKIDPRIAKAMDIIKLSPEKQYNQESLAADLGLSASRFRHLFKEHSDIPFRRYRMWRRMITAISCLHKVDSLTFAAMEGGFTDSAHFNRCFQDIFGINPSRVFKNIDRFEV